MPCHGKLNCSVCWGKSSNTVQEIGKFRFVRDPGHWGSAEPQTLILGISKGETQSKAINYDAFDEVGFKKMRPRMLEVLNAVGLLPGEEIHQFNRRFTKDERNYAFASVVRCSITGFDRKTDKHNASSPNVTPAFKAGSDGYSMVKNCITTFLKSPSLRTKLVVLLGNEDSYMKSFRGIIEEVRGPIVPINSVAFDSQGIRFVHITHPSPGNGNFGKFICGEGKSGMKRDSARQALLPFIRE